MSDTKHLIPGISAVIPVYRSVSTLPSLISRLTVTLDSIAPAHEIILVDDASPDESWQVICGASSDDPRIRGVRLMRNFGQHNALLVGIRKARHELVVTLDDDLQNPPEEIGRILARLTDDVDVVYGTPELEQHGLWRHLASRVTKYALKSAMDVEAARNVSSFRVFRTDLRRAFDRYQSPHLAIDVLLTWATSRFASVTVRQDPRPAGRSGYNLHRLTQHALNMMTGFSTRPLRLASMVGFAFTLFGAVVCAYVVLRYLVAGTTVPGFTFLAAIVSIFSGVQLLILGIMGEYLARMHFRLMERPAYVVAETTDDQEDGT